MGTGLSRRPGAAVGAGGTLGPCRLPGPCGDAPAAPPSYTAPFSSAEAAAPRQACQPPGCKMRPWSRWELACRSAAGPAENQEGTAFAHRGRKNR